MGAMNDRVTAVVLGAGVWPGGEPSPTLRRRAMHAAALLRVGEVERAVLCGGVGEHPPSEARVMARLIEAEGVAAERLVLEERSTDTISNISNALALCPGMTRVVIVTDDFHSRRAKHIARHLGLTARASCPAVKGLGRRRILKARTRESFAMLKVWIWMATGYHIR